MRRTLAIALVASILSCKSQPAAPTPTPAPATPTGSGSPQSSSPLSDYDRAMKIATGLKGVRVGFYYWCDFEPRGELLCRAIAGVKGVRGRWSMEDGPLRLVGSAGDETFAFELDYVSDQLLNVRTRPTDKLHLLDGFYCGSAGGGRVCEAWWGLLVGVQDAGGGPTATKAAETLRKSQREMSHVIEDPPGGTGWMGNVVVLESKPASAPRSGSHVTWAEEFQGPYAKRMALDVEVDLGRVERVTESPAPFDIRVIAGKGFSKPPRIRVAVRDGVCREEEEECFNRFMDQIVEAATTEKFVALEGVPTKESRSKMEIWFMPGKDAEAGELRALLGENARDAVPQKWEWGGDFDLLVIAGSE